MKKKLIIGIVIIIVLIVGLIIFFFKKENHDNSDLEVNEIEEVDKNQVSYQENVTVEDLKKDIGATGDTEIYEIQQEYDGRNIITIKPSIRYKVAFAGMIKNSIPTMEELDTIINGNLPEKSGIWINEESREKVLELFNDESLNSNYIIDDEGYLKIQDENNQNEMDKKIANIINGDKQYILDISSVCYIVDDLTGEILDYNFEDMDQYQVYEYFDDNDRSIIFITENSNSLMTETEILNSVVELF